MDSINCQVCKKECKSTASLHRHLRAHTLSIPQYYHTFYPRHDKFDGSLIQFRNKEQYFSSDFNNRRNLQLWIDNTEAAEVRLYIKAMLEARIARKKLVWTPSQVELRSCMLPPIQTYQKLFGDYYILCERLGLKNKFYDKKLEQMPFSDYTIYIDTREQKPLEFSKHKSLEQTLKFGDYACSSHIRTCCCYIERKSPQDFLGTFSGGFERFCRELDRAVAAEAYVVILIEESLANCLQFPNLPHIYHKDSKITPEFVFHNVRDIMQKYVNCQFLFVKNRVEAANMIEKIFDSNCSYRSIDLQYLYDTKMI